MTRSIAAYGTAIVLAHLVITILHGVAHADLQIGLSTLQKLFVLIVINVCPLVATVLLWTRRQRAGLALLSVSMGASLMFGVWNHFILSGPDHVAEVAPGAMGHLFQLTAAMLALIEAVGAWLGFVWMRRSARSQAL
jgi:hypothetical protein